MKKLLLTSLCVFTALFIYSQGKYTLSGYVKDSLSEETLIGASVSINNAGKGVSSNQYGFYSITLPKGHYSIIVSFAGYRPKQTDIELDSNIIFNFQLLQKSVLEEVVVSSRRRDANVKNAQMGKIDLAMAQVKSLPVLLGEVDILKTLQLLPGVRNAGEGNTGLYVRGGGPDQNLIL